MDENRKLLVGEAADQLEASLWRQQQSQHTGLTITDLYNVLEKVRRKEELTATDKAVHQQGLVSVLNKIHENLDAAVAEAYGWPVDLSDEEILRRLVVLNAERAEEERRGIIRWLRPEFQNPGGAATTQQSLAIAGIEAKPVKAAGRAKKPAWPKEMVGQVLAVRGALTAGGGPLSPGDVAAKFKGVKEPVIAELLVALEALGQARRVDGGRYAA